MTGAQRVRGLELALALLAGSAVLIALIVALDVLRFALPALLEGTHPPVGHHEVALAILAAADALVAVAARSVAAAPGARAAARAPPARRRPARRSPGAP